MVRLLGNKLDATLYYDKKGFLEKKPHRVIYFNENSTTDNTISFTYELLEIKDNYYKYYICIQEEITRAHFVATGIVEFFLQGKNIISIVVNGVENGKLHDKYDDSFDIRPEDYLHIIKRAN